MNMDELRAMEIGEVRERPGNKDGRVERVPGGWIYTNGTIRPYQRSDGLSDNIWSDTAPTFVPDPLIALAGQAMQGLLAKNGATHIPSMAMEATEYAKSLLAELERSE